MEAIERRSESPLSKNRSSSRLSNLSSQDFSDDSDTALIEHVKAKKRGRPKKPKEKENGDFHPDENGTDDQIQTNGTHSDHGSDKIDNDDETPKIVSSKDSHIVVMEISRENSEVDAGEDGDMIDLQIEEVEETVDVEDNPPEEIVITTSENDIEGETVELSVSEIPDAKVETVEIAPDKDDGKPGMSELEVEKDFDDQKTANDNDNDNDNNTDDRWSVMVNVDTTDQKDLLENQSENADKDADSSNNSFTNKISSLLGSWSPIQGKKDGENVPVFYPRISGRPGLKSGTPDRNIAGPSKDFKTPTLSLFLDDSFRVKSEPAKFRRQEEDKSHLKKYRGKRCLNSDESEENDEGFFSRLSFRKRRKLNDSTESTSAGFFGSVFRSPFKKRAVSDVKIETNQESKFSWLFSPFIFAKKKNDDIDDDVSSAEIAVEESASPATSSSSAATSDDVIKTDDKPLETKETGGCSIM